MSLLRTFQITNTALPNGPPSAEHPLTNPMTMILGNYPISGNVHNPNVALLHAAPNPHDEYQTPLWTMLTAGSPERFPPSPNPSHTRFWFKTYSENEGVLPQLEARGIVQSTGITKKQGFVTLVAVDVLVPRSEWANICPSCGTWEQTNDPKRMACCSRCKRTFYCSAECQREHWPEHKEECRLNDAQRGQKRHADHIKEMEASGFQVVNS